MDTHSHCAPEFNKDYGTVLVWWLLVWDCVPQTSDVVYICNTGPISGRYHWHILKVYKFQLYYYLETKLNLTKESFGPWFPFSSACFHTIEQIDLVNRTRKHALHAFDEFFSLPDVCAFHFVTQAHEQVSKEVLHRPSLWSLQQATFKDINNVTALRLKLLHTMIH